MLAVSRPVRLAVSRPVRLAVSWPVRLFRAVQIIRGPASVSSCSSTITILLTHATAIYRSGRHGRGSGVLEPSAWMDQDPIDLKKWLWLE